MFVDNPFSLILTVEHYEKCKCSLCETSHYVLCMLSSFGAKMAASELFLEILK